MPAVKFVRKDEETYKCKPCKEVVNYREIDQHVKDKHPNATSVSVDTT